MSWWVYMLECADDTLYTGVTTDVPRRLDEHNTSAKGARYTRARRPVTLAAAWSTADRSAACKAEHRLKRLTRSQKLALLSDDDALEELGLGIRYEGPTDE